MARRPPMLYISLMPTYPHIERYHADKQRLIEFCAARNRCGWDIDPTIPLSLTQ